MRKPTFSFTSTLRALQSDAAYAARRVAEAKRCKDDIMSDVAIAKLIVGDAVTSSQYARIDFGTLRITVGIDAASLKDDPNLTAILSRALDHSEPQETSDWATESWAERAYNFRLPHGGYLKIEASVASDSPTCRKILTGVKLVEQKTYAIACD